MFIHLIPQSKDRGIFLPEICLLRSLASGVRRAYQSERSGDLIKLRNFVQRMQVLLNLRGVILIVIVYQGEGFRIYRFL